MKTKNIDFYVSDKFFEIDWDDDEGHHNVRMAFVRSKVWREPRK